MMFSPQEYTDHSLSDLKYRLDRVNKQARRSQRKQRALLEIEAQYLKELIRKIESGELVER